MHAWRRLAAACVVSLMIWGCLSTPTVIDTDIECPHDPFDVLLLHHVVRPALTARKAILQDRMIGRFLDAMALCLEVTGQATR